MEQFTVFLNEGTNLAPSELYKYDWRLELFIRKFKNGEPLTLTNKKSVVLSYDSAIEDQLRNKDNPAKIKLLGQDGQFYTLGKFAKTEEFGGGGGSRAGGAGSKITKITESAQCLYCQARWMGKTEYDDKSLSTAYSLCDVDESLTNIIEKLPTTWRDSCILGAEKLYSLFGNKQYEFHRGSKWVQSLENTFKKLNKANKSFANLNKWSPADIYMISPVGKNIKFSSAQNLVELNDILKNALKNKDIIGVSLKMLKNNAKVSYQNFDSKKPDAKYDSYSTGKRGFFKSKDILLYFSINGKIQFRTFPTTFQGEIKGRNANQGKVSYGPINNILKRLKLPSLSDTRKLKSLLDKTDDSVMKIFYERYCRYSIDSSNISYNGFVEQCNKNGDAWSFSKFIGCELLDILIKNKAEDKFISACIQYASSNSELSGPFIKLE